MANKEQVVFTKVAGSEAQFLPEDAPAAAAAKAFRAFQLGEVPNTAEEAVKVGLPHPDTQTIPESQVEVPSNTELVYTNDTQALPKGASGAKIADGVFEVVRGSQAAPDAKSTPVNPKAKDAIERFGTHPVRLEDDTHTNQS